jgi:hypothetical protein
MDRLFAEHGEWQRVAEYLGVNERTLRTERRQARNRAASVRDPMFEQRVEAAKVALEEKHEEWRTGGEIVESVDDFEDEEPTIRNHSWQDATSAVPAQSGSAIYRTTFDSEQRHIKKLTRKDCPDGTLMLWASDIHIPIQNDPVCRLMVECAERAGVTRVIAGGDILDINCLSKHAKESHRTVEHATILEEVEPGRWLLDWFATKNTTMFLGNHELRLKRFIDENPAFHGSVAGNFAKVCDLPAGIEVIEGEVRLGNLALFHGHDEFKNGTGGKYPAQKILDMFPDQSSIHGHLHRFGTAYRTTVDEDGVKRTRRVYSMAHLSHEHMHYGYVSRNPNWQTGFGLIRVWWEDDRPRWTVYQVEVLFDRNNRPYFEFEGRLYR